MLPLQCRRAALSCWAELLGHRVAAQPQASDAIKDYNLGRPGQPASATFPITAWWGPV